MCVSTARAEFKGTKIYVGLRDLPNVGEVRVLMYQNQVQSFSADPNSMLLHIPTHTRMSEENFIDMTHATGALKDMEKSLTPMAKGINFASDNRRSLGSSSVQIFESGAYTVVLADDAREIHAALTEVPVEKRPYIKPELLDFYQEHYGEGYKFALACFNNRDMVNADPIGLWYVPSDETKDYLIFPALDSHTGDAPDVYSPVGVDHWLFCSAPEMQGGTVVQYSKAFSEEVAKFLPKIIKGDYFKGPMQNGDFRFPLDRVIVAEKPAMERVFPGVVSMNA